MLHFIFLNKTYSFIQEYLILLIALEFILLLVFTSLDFFIFYILFESILIPMFILIGIFGSRQRKTHASYLLFFYTFIGSFLMLFSMINLYSHAGTTDFYILQCTEFNDIRENLICFVYLLHLQLKFLCFHFIHGYLKHM